MEALHLNCFGVGDGAPSADRNHSSYLYDFKSTVLLLDCGEPASRHIKAASLGPDLIDRLFISHLHSDHFGGLFMLLQGFWLERRRKPLVINLPEDGIKPLQQMLQAAYLFDELLPFPLSFEPLQTGKPVDLAGVRVTSYPTSHLSDLRMAYQDKYPGQYASFCFLLETSRMRIVHSADLGRPEDLEPLLSEPLDLLVCELAHFDPGEVFDYLQGRNIKRIAFIHVGRPYWSDLKPTRRLAEKILGADRVSFPLDSTIIQVRSS